MTMTHQHHRDHQDRPQLGRDERTPGTGRSRSTPERPRRDARRWSVAVLVAAAARFPGDHTSGA
jgi:hypothetical protein